MKRKLIIFSMLFGSLLLLFEMQWLTIIVTYYEAILTNLVCSMFETRLNWVNITPFGRPVVPLENGKATRSSLASVSRFSGKSVMSLSRRLENGRHFSPVPKIIVSFQINRKHIGLEMNKWILVLACRGMQCVYKPIVHAVTMVILTKCMKFRFCYFIPQHFVAYLTFHI